MTDEELKEETRPWYQRGLAGKIVPVVVAGAFLSSVGWAAAQLMAASSAKVMTEKNEQKIEKVEDTQKDIEGKLVPAINGLKKDVTYIREDVREIKDEIKPEGRP